MFENSDKLIAPSESIIKKILESGLLRDKKQVKLLPHGIKPPKTKKLYPSFSGKVRFGFIGTPSKRKGTHVLIEAFNRLNINNVELKSK